MNRMNLQIIHSTLSSLMIANLLPDNTDRQLLPENFNEQKWRRIILILQALLPEEFVLWQSFQQYEMIKKRVIGAGSETSICFPIPVKIIYHYLLWSLACTLAEPMIQGISICLWELSTLHSYLWCACMSSPTYAARSTYATNSGK